VRRYGFHGMSHQYISQVARDEHKGKKIITCHLGNGASIAAIDDGVCVDTSMGLTPLEGVMMGTRSGDIDPGAVEYLANKKGLSHAEIIEYLSRECGIKGVFGKNDMRDVYAGMLAGDNRARLVFEMFCYRIIKYIGAYAAVLGGVDTIVFTAGIGEFAFYVREEICKNLGYLGLQLDLGLNRERCLSQGKGGVISAKDSTVKVIIIPTNEELVIARETLTLMQNV